MLGGGEYEQDGIRHESPWAGDLCSSLPVDSYHLMWHQVYVTQHCRPKHTALTHNHHQLTIWKNTLFHLDVK